MGRLNRKPRVSRRFGNKRKPCSMQKLAVRFNYSSFISASAFNENGSAKFCSQATSCGKNGYSRFFLRIIAIRNCAKERFIFIPKPVMGFSLLTFIAELNPGLQLTQHILYVPQRTRESRSRTRVSFDSTGFWSHYNILRPATLLNQVSQEKD